MISVLLVTHGQLAQVLLASAETIAGERPYIRALSLEWNEGIDAARLRIAQTVEELDRGEGVLILTDMYGSTPSNAAISLSVPGRVEVITGVSLPMVVRLSCCSVLPGNLVETARWLVEKGRRSITRAAAAEPAANAQVPGPGDPCGDLEPAAPPAPASPPGPEKRRERG
jgi:mannose PTS system EIIA component